MEQSAEKRIAALVTLALNGAEGHMRANGYPEPSEEQMARLLEECGATVGILVRDSADEEINREELTRRCAAAGVHAVGQVFGAPPAGRN